MASHVCSNEIIVIAYCILRTMSTFSRAASKLLSGISWHTNVILGLQDVQDPTLDVHAITFSHRDN